jgi:hypothetical protein
MVKMMCTGFKRNGQPCGFKCKKGTTFCGHHQPVLKEVPLPQNWILTSRLPVEAVSTAERLLTQLGVQLELMPANKKAAGYWSYCNLQHKIQLADNLYGVDFLETFIHELAHATKWELYRNSGTPHGKEWKAEYHKHLRMFLPLRSWTSQEMEKLSKPGTRKNITLCELRTRTPGRKFVCELEKGQEFVYKGIRYLVKNKGRGVNYICTKMGTDLNYVFSKTLCLDD